MNKLVMTHEEVSKAFNRKFRPELAKTIDSAENILKIIDEIFEEEIKRRQCAELKSVL